PGELLPKRRVHALGTLPSGRQPCRGRDSGLFLRVAAAQLEAPPAEEVGNDLVDPVFPLAVHSRRTFAAARNARSCMTLIAPTVDFISEATSFNEYPWRKRSSRTD